MHTQASRGSSGRGRFLIGAALAITIAGCTAAQPQTPSAVAATATSAATPQSSTPGPGESVAASADASSGPVGYEAWVERQGFGGSSGLRQAINDAQFIKANAYTVTAFDVDDGARRIDLLAAWLDEHPPTACWADYHAAMRSALGRAHDGYVSAREARTAGTSIPTDVAAALVDEIQAAYDVAAPTGC